MSDEDTQDIAADEAFIEQAVSQNKDADKLDQEIEKAINPSVFPYTEEPPESVPDTTVVAPILHTEEPVKDELQFLGTLYPAGMLRPKVGLPVVLRINDTFFGVVVVSDPGYLGHPLELFLERAGYNRPFVQLAPHDISPAIRMAAARAIAAQADPTIDMSAALAALGMGRSSTSL